MRNLLPTARPSRLAREGSVGLLILLGLGLLTTVILWLRGITLGERSYSLRIQFADAGGLELGAPVRYRGVTIGRATAIHPGPNGVEVEVTISPATVVIPRQVEVETSESGLISQTVINFEPLGTFTADRLALPRSKNCNPQLILCNGEQVRGHLGVSIEQLIRTSIQFSEAFSNPQFLSNLNRAIANTSSAAVGITRLSGDVSGLTRSLNGQIGTLATSAQSITSAAHSIDNTAAQLDGLIRDNRARLRQSVDNLALASQDLRINVHRLGPLLDQVQKGRLIENLTTFADNAAQISVSLRHLGSTATNPALLIGLYQLLSSARTTFQNTAAITTQLRKVTDDPELRKTLHQLILNLNKLLSSTQSLQQETDLARALTPGSSSYQLPPHPQPLDLLQLQQQLADLEKQLPSPIPKSPS